MQWWFQTATENFTSDNDTLPDVGIDNSTTIATFTIKFYYTLQFQGSTAG